MDLNVISRGVRRLRIARRLTQPALAEAAELSLSAVKNLECARAYPRMSTIQAIVRALDVRIEDLSLPVRELHMVHFRSLRRVKHRDTILMDIAHRLDDFNCLEEMLDEQRPFLLRDVRKRCSRKNAVKAAEICREALDLDKTSPIRGFCELLEHAGIKIFPVPSASRVFFGLSVGEGDGGPAIALNTWDRIPVELRIFSAAHELGHLLLHPGVYDVRKAEGGDDEGEAANRFASHLLMPDEGFLAEWKKASGLHWVDRVLKVKNFFRVSYKTVLIRLQELNVMDESVWEKFNVAHRERFRRRITLTEEPLAIASPEPFGLQRYEFYTGRFNRLVRMAIEKDKISISRGAELLHIGIEDMRKLLASWKALP